MVDLCPLASAKSNTRDRAMGAREIGVPTNCRRQLIYAGSVTRDCNHEILDETACCQIEVSLIEVSAGWGIRSICEGLS